MWDFVAALGLVFAIEGILFAGAPQPPTAALRPASDTPPETMRLIGIGSAALGVLLVWFVRG
jgi:uncharacterized protein YjeT (DUF2065 family)